MENRDEEDAHMGIQPTAEHGLKFSLIGKLQADRLFLSWTVKCFGICLAAGLEADTSLFLEFSHKKHVQCPVDKEWQGGSSLDKLQWFDAWDDHLFPIYIYI